MTTAKKGSEEKSCNPECNQHSNIEDRVHKLEEAINEIRQELKSRAISDARMEKAVETMAQTLLVVQSDTKELRTDLLGLVAKTLEKTQEDMANFIRMNDKSAEKDAEFERKIREMETAHQMALEAKNQDNTRKDSQTEKAFYRKLILTCVAIGGTIVLTFFGIKALIPILG